MKKLIKNLTLVVLSTFLIQSAYAGEVTGAGIMRTLQRHNVDITNFKQMGLDIVVKQRNNVNKLPLGNIKYYVGSDMVFPSQKVNRVEFKPNLQNKFLWPNVESLEFNNQMVLPTDIQGFVIQKPAR